MGTAGRFRQPGQFEGTRSQRRRPLVVFEVTGVGWPFHRNQAQTGYDLWIASVTRPGDDLQLSAIKPLLVQPGIQAAPAISPDNKWIAYSSDGNPVGPRSTSRSSRRTVVWRDLPGECRLTAAGLLDGTGPARACFSGLSTITSSTSRSRWKAMRFWRNPPFKRVERANGGRERSSEL